MLIRKARMAGKSLVVTIPSQVAEMYNIKAGEKLKIETAVDGIFIRKEISV